MTHKLNSGRGTIVTEHYTTLKFLWGINLATIQNMGKCQKYLYIWYILSKLQNLDKQISAIMDKRMEISLKHKVIIHRSNQWHIPTHYNLQIWFSCKMLYANYSTQLIWSMFISVHI